MKVYYEETPYGFKFGSMEITRITSDEKRGWGVLEIKTKKKKIEIYATKTGKMVITERNP